MISQLSARHLPTDRARLALTLLLAAALATVPRPALPGVLQHENASCQLCHFVDDASRSAGLARQGACQQCHREVGAGVAADLGFHDGRGRSCSQCHSFHEPTQLRVPGGRMDRAALQRAGAGHCASCHGAGGSLSELSAAHWAAASRYHTDVEALRGLSPSDGCLLCHAADSQSDWNRSYPEAGAGFDRHRSHPMGVPNRATRAANAFLVRSGEQVGLPLPNGRIECQTCHLVPSRTDHLLRVDSAREEICVRCHERNGQERPFVAAGLGNF